MRLPYALTPLLKAVALPLVLGLLMLNTLPHTDKTTYNTAYSADVVLDAGTVKKVDIPDSKAKRLSLEIEQGHLGPDAVGALKLSVDNIDFRAGTLSALSMTLKDGFLGNLPMKSLSLVTQPFAFDTAELLTYRRFVLDKPVNATIQLELTEEGLNRFFSSPAVLGKLAEAAGKQTGNFVSVRFANPSLRLTGGDAVLMKMNTVVGDALIVPVELQGHLVLSGGKLNLSGTQMLAGGAQLPLDIAAVLQKKLNDMMDWSRLSKKRLLIQGETLTITKGRIQVNGHATLNRLEFGG